MVHPKSTLSSDVHAQRAAGAASQGRAMTRGYALLGHKTGHASGRRLRFSAFSLVKLCARQDSSLRHPH
jgi:hypothetical protein